MLKVRRVVTGHNAQQRAVVEDDAAVEPIRFPMLPGFRSFEMWSEKGQRTVPHHRGRPEIERYFPDEDEVVFRYAIFPPAGYEEDNSGRDLAAEEAAVARRYPGLMEQLMDGEPGMHTTDSVDFGIVISGEIYLELDDGEEVLLTPGSCVVQNGTRHAWRNRSDQEVLMAFVLLGSKRRR